MYKKNFLDKQKLKETALLNPRGNIKSSSLNRKEEKIYSKEKITIRKQIILISQDMA